MIGYGWGNACYIVNFPPREYLLYGKVSGGRFAMRKVYYTTPVLEPTIDRTRGEHVNHYTTDAVASS